MSTAFLVGMLLGGIVGFFAAALLYVSKEK
jgi:gas vesicle protein